MKFNKSVKFFFVSLLLLSFPVQAEKEGKSLRLVENLTLSDYAVSKTSRLFHLIEDALSDLNAQVTIGACTGDCKEKIEAVIKAYEVLEGSLGVLAAVIGEDSANDVSEASCDSLTASLADVTSFYDSQTDDDSDAYDQKCTALAKSAEIMRSMNDLDCDLAQDDVQEALSFFKENTSEEGSELLDCTPDV